MDNVAVANDSPNLIGLAFAKLVGSPSHFVCNWLKRDVEHGLTLAASLGRHAGCRIEENNLAPSKRKSEARPWCLMMHSQPFTYATQLLQRNVVLLSQDRDSTKTYQIAKRVDSAEGTSSVSINERRRKKLRVVPVPYLSK